MTSHRRTILLAFGGAALALAGAGGVFVATRRPLAALKPWDDIQATTRDMRLDAFRHAILAPNPHNRQPWQIQLVGTDQAIITCDLDKRLPETDPFDRQITIGFGAFLELARIAAAERGLRLDTTLFPRGEPQPRLTADPIAHLRFVADATVQKDPLYAAIPIRRTVKVPFDVSRLPPQSSIQSLASSAVVGTTTRIDTDPSVVADLRDLTWRAWVIEAETGRTFKESIDLMRIGRSEIEANPDGVALGGAVIEALAMAGQITRAAIADPKSGAFKAGLDRYRPIMAGTPAYLTVVTPGNSRAEQIAAGRSYVRANLMAAANGLSLHPVSQALQEYPEMATEYMDVHRRLKVVTPNRLQMLARLGFGPAVDVSPRWPLEAKLKT